MGCAHGCNQLPQQRRVAGFAGSTTSVSGLGCLPASQPSRRSCQGQDELDCLYNVIHFRGCCAPHYPCRCGIFAWSEPLQLALAVAVSVLASLVFRLAATGGMDTSVLIASIAMAWMAIVAPVWLTGNVFRSGIDAVVHRLKMRRNAFHSEALLRAALPGPIARAFLQGVPARYLCHERESCSIAFLNLCDYPSMIDRFSEHPKGLVKVQVRNSSCPPGMSRPGTSNFVAF